jgi:hypothetical protein
VEGRFAALVRGPSPVFPRGILGVVLVWYAAASVALLVFYRLLDWYGPIALAGLLLGVLTLLAVLSTMRNNAFVADQTAIWLGLRAGAVRRVGRRRRALRKLPWSDVQQVRITWRPYGVRVDIMLGPAAPLAGRAHPVLSAFAGLMLLVLPASYLVRLPSLVVPHAGTRRYRVQIYDLRPEAVRAALRDLAPRTVAVTVYSLFGRPRTMATPPPAGIAQPGARPAAAPAAPSPPATALPAPADPDTPAAAPVTLDTPAVAPADPETPAAAPAADSAPAWPKPVPPQPRREPEPLDAEPVAPGRAATELPAEEAPGEKTPAEEKPADEAAVEKVPAAQSAERSAEPAAGAPPTVAARPQPAPATKTQPTPATEPQPTPAEEPQTTPAEEPQTTAPAG